MLPIYFLSLGVICFLLTTYRSGHSTETALLSILDGLYQAIDNKQTAVLVSLDLSAAFDTISHRMLLHRLKGEFGVSGLALAWVKSYLCDRRQFVKIGKHQSASVPCDLGVPQGSVLGPLLFVAYMCHRSAILSRPQDLGSINMQGGGWSFISRTVSFPPLL